MKKEEEERKLHRMVKVHIFLKMWQGSLIRCATQMGSRAQNKQMIAVGYIPDTEEIVKASWSHFHHDDAAAFNLAERSSLPPALSAKDLAGGQTQIFNGCRIRGINPHPVESDENSAPESIADTEHCLNWNGDLNSPTGTDDNGAAHATSDIEQGNGIQDAECPVRRDVSAAPNDPGLIRLPQKFKSQAEMVFVTVNAVETRRNTGEKTK